MISIIVPAYNEEKRITPTIHGILEKMLAHTTDFEILIVNDGSTDQTAEVVKKQESQYVKLLSYEKNRGKGGAVKYGIEKAEGEYVIFTDADLPYPPEKIIDACRMMEQGADVILGKRVQKENGGKYPWYRTLMSKTFGLIVKMITGLKEKDTQCGFKAFKNKPAKEIFKRVTLSGWGFDVEVIFLAEKLQYQIKRLEVELFHENEESKINIVSDTLKMLKDVCKVRKNYKKGKYDI